MSIVLIIAIAVVIMAGLVCLGLPVVLSSRVSHPRTRESLDGEKLVHEIDEARYGWYRTLGTAMLTLGLGVAGLALQQGIAETDASKRQLQSDKEVFARFLGDVGDSNATKRVAAIAYLADRLIESPRSVSGEEKRQVIEALGYQLSIESDLTVADSLRSNLVRIATTDDTSWNQVFSEMVDANRRAAFSYANALGVAIGKQTASFYQLQMKMPASALFDLDPQGEDLDPQGKAAVKDSAVQLGRETSDALIVFSAHGFQDDFLQFTASPTQDIHGIFRRSFNTTVRKNTDASGPIPYDKEGAILVHSSFAITMTANMIGTLIRSCGDVRSQTSICGAARSLSGTLIPHVNFRTLNLSNVDLTNALVGAELGGAKLDFALLRGTDFSRADFSPPPDDGSRPAAKARASIRGADVAGAVLAPNIERYATLYGSNLYEAYEARTMVDGITTNHPFPYASDLTAKREHDECDRVSKNSVCRWKVKESRP